MGIKPDASPQEIRREYRKLVFRYHPDQNRSGLSGAARFHDIKEAYEHLSDPVKRKYHDAMLRSIHVYAPSYSFGKYSSIEKEKKESEPEEVIPKKTNPLWKVLLKPVIFILVSIAVMRLIMSPPHWLQEWLSR